MTCWTTTLHHVLHTHPKIWLPDGELGFWDADDLLEHPSFGTFDGQNWEGPDPLSTDGHHWYRTQFDGAPPGSLIGEDSTTYISSLLALRRIRDHCPGTKLIICIRDPASRAYSQYWHMLRSGRVFRSFDDVLRYEPHKVLPRSIYLPSLERLTDLFPPETYMIVLFEEMIRDASIFEESCTWLGVDPALLPVNSLSEHRNPSTLPRSLTLQRLVNRAFPFYLSPGGHRRWSPSEPSKGSLTRMKHLVRQAYQKLNPSLDVRPPSMSMETRRYLDRYLWRQNAGLEALIQKDLTKWWYRSRNK